MNSIGLLHALLSVTFAAGPSFAPDEANELAFPAQEAKFVQFVIMANSSGQPCVDELEVYGPEGQENLALSSKGAKATASSCLAGYPIHKIEHLNDGQYGNDYSWIAATGDVEWAQIELPSASKVAKVVFSRDRKKQFRDRMPLAIEVRLSLDGQTWKTACRAMPEGFAMPVVLPDPVTWEGLLRYAFLCEHRTWRRINAADHISPLRVARPAAPGGEPYWGRIARLDPTARSLVQMEEMIERLAAKGLEVSQEREQLGELRLRQGALAADSAPEANVEQALDEQALYLDARSAKRKLMFRDPDLEPLRRILFVKRHPYLASHNYSDILDSQFRPGGGICVLDIPRSGGRLEPSDAGLTTLFDGSQGIARDPIASFWVNALPVPGRVSRRKHNACSDVRMWCPA